MISLIRYAEKANSKFYTKAEIEKLKADGIITEDNKDDYRQSDIEYYITETNGDIIIKVEYNYREVLRTKEFVYNKLENVGNFIQVDCGTFTYGFDFIQYNVLDIIDNQFYKSRIQHPHDTIFRILFEPNGNILIMWLRPYKAIKGFNNIEMDTNKTVMGAFVDNSKWFANRYKTIRKKATLLNYTDIYKSVAYLEAQVDVLTRALLTVLPKDSELYNTLIEADRNSVLNIKPLNDIQDEFKVSKANFRNLQEKYYGELQQ